MTADNGYISCDQMVKDLLELERLKYINKNNNKLKELGITPEPTLMDFEKLEESKRAKIMRTYLVPKETVNDDNQNNEENEIPYKEVDTSCIKYPVLSLDTIGDVLLSYDNTLEAFDKLFTNMKSKVEKGSKRYDQLSYLIYSLKILE